MSKIPVPPTGSIISSINTSCKDARIAANIQVHPESIAALLKSPIFQSTIKKLSLAHGVTMPLQFPSVLDEINLISLLSLLNFAHGYRIPLRNATGRGAYDSIRALIFGLYLSSSTEDDLMSAKGIGGISKARVADLMQLTNFIHTEKSHPTIPGLKIGELGGPLYELVGLITGVLNETGKILVDRGYPNLGTFVLEALKKGQKEGTVDVEIVLAQIIGAIPAFQDVGSYNGKDIYVYKKVLFLLHALVLRFGGRDEPTIPLPDTTKLPIFSDNVIPSMLVHLGILDISASSLPRLRTNFGALTVAENLKYDPTDGMAEGEQSKTDLVEGPELTEEEAYVMRAAAVDACQMIVDAAIEEGADSLTLPELDGWLWSVAKEGRFRTSLVRFRQTAPCIMY